MKTLTYGEAIREALFEEMASDDRVLVFGEDVAGYGGLDGVTHGLQKRFGRDRVFDTPISESGFAGLAVGAALMGMRPVAEMQFSGLLTVPLDQIVNSAAKARYVHDGAMSCPMVIRAVTYPAGNAYMGQSLEAWLAHVPGLKVVTPSTPIDAKGLLLTSIRDPDPVVFFEHKSLYSTEGLVPEEAYSIPLGEASIAREGADVTIVAWLNMVPAALEAADDLSLEGIDLEVIDLRSLIPLDEQTITQSVLKTGRLVVAHEAVTRAGFGAEVTAVVANSDAVHHLKAPVQRVGNPGVPVPHSDRLNTHIIPSKDDLITAVRIVLST